MRRGERIRWDARLSKPLADGGATICEKHDFALANYEDQSMAWEVCQALTQAKDDGERMERRIQDLGEEADNLEACLDDTEEEIVRLKIAHLRRMINATVIVESRALKNCLTYLAWNHLDRYRDRERQIVGRIDRFRSACLAKITELKELQCSTKP